MRENKLRLTLAMAYIIHERNYLYEYKLPGQDKPPLEKAVNVDFVPVLAYYVSRGQSKLRLIVSCINGPIVAKGVHWDICKPLGINSAEYKM